MSCCPPINKALSTVTGCIAALVLLCGSVDVAAQHVPVVQYKVRDGLAYDRVQHIYQDSIGYIWFSTWEGLSRFDGYRFVNYGVRDGLQNSLVTMTAEDKRGRLWVSTWGSGVARLASAEESGKVNLPKQRNTAVEEKFIHYAVGNSRQANEVYGLLFDDDDTLWCLTYLGLYRGIDNQIGGLDFEIVAQHPSCRPLRDWPRGFAKDSRGRLWFGVADELIEVDLGQVKRHAPPEEARRNQIMSIAEYPQEGLYVAYPSKLFRFVPSTDLESKARWVKVPLILDSNQQVRTVLADRSGVLWIGTTAGLIKYHEGRQIVYATTQGLSDDHVRALAEDRDRNIWIGTWLGGVCKLSSEMIVSFTRAEGLPDQNVISVIQDREGRIYATTEHGGVLEIAGGRVVPIPESQTPPFNNIGSRILQDSRGDWWIGTDVGLFRFRGPRLRFRNGEKHPTLPRVTGRMLEDRFGRIWISSTSLYWIDRPWSRFSRLQSLPLNGFTLHDTLRSLAIDRTGVVWLAAHLDVGRLSDGKIARLAADEGLPETRIRCLYQDSRGWMWIGSRYKGVSVTVDPAAEHPRFTNHSSQNGLASDAVYSIIEDDFGRVYLGTGRGIDQLDPATGRIFHVTTADGLAGDFVNDLLKDNQGNIWAATAGGLSKLNAGAERKLQPNPPIYLSHVQLAGEDRQLPERGAAAVGEFTLPPSQNSLVVEYVGLSFNGGQALKYQYKLEGMDADWSIPTEQRSVNYAHLPPGSYRFIVRAINQEGAASVEPAVLAFRILPPIWQRWWFVVLATVLVGVVVYGIHGYRVARLIEIERIRARIATDLHDDIGSDLSLIAMLSEVARRQVQGKDSQMAERLSSIACTSRELVDSMGDIVWAVNPRKDRLRDLTQRMRRLADDMLSSRNIRLSFSGPGPDEDMRISADMRRDLFLIFKESVNNLARHSQCTEADIQLWLERGKLILKVSDNGRGFDPAELNGGNGLASMRERARKLAGQLQVISNPGDGATVKLVAPLARRPGGFPHAIEG